ncbi:MAG: response regulator transcription factor [Paludibacteraceae bacterium]|nr:response regulator transcription factor [Paludibacteraceae bacterium]MBP6284519.1 response regulator transcription factor [Paludibacteraceae bacterium]
MSTYKILVVDDEEDLCDILQYNLEKDGYLVDIAYSAEEALKKNLSEYSLFLLDVMMGEMSGFKLGALLKKDDETAHIPIIFVTAKDTENDTLTGFNIGADDYITKPYSIKEVLARVRVLLKRTSEQKDGAPMSKDKILRFEQLLLNLTTKTTLIDKKEISLTKKEFEMLSLLMSQPNNVFSREDILGQIWNDAPVTDRTIDVNITRLRKKIEPYDKNVVTRLGYGYCFETSN